VTVLSFGFAVNKATAETPTDALTVHEAYEIASNHFHNNPNFENDFDISYSGVNLISERHTPLISGHRFQVDFSTGEVIFCYIAIHGGAIFYADLNDEWVEIVSQ
jgi:hypothetical protein